MSEAHSHFPYAASQSEQIQFLLGYATKAPSVQNTQPWFFETHGDTVSLIADRTRVLKVVDPQYRQVFMSCGAALMHLRVTLRHFGFRENICVFPEDGTPFLVARIRIEKAHGIPRTQDDLFDAIPRRHTNRSIFSTLTVPVDLVCAMADAAVREGALLRGVSDTDERRRVAHLIAEGDVTQWSDPGFREERATWVRTAGRDITDGVPAESLGLGMLRTSFAPFLIRHFDLGERQSRWDEDLVENAPELFVLTTPADMKFDWVAAGQALARILLMGARHGVSASFFNQPVEVHDLREKLRETLDLESYPQLIFRLGYGADQHTTPRRPVKDVVGAT